MKDVISWKIVAVDPDSGILYTRGSPSRTGCLKLFCVSAAEVVAEADDAGFALQVRLHGRAAELGRGDGEGTGVAADI